jgi:hypothetical protein
MLGFPRPVKIIRSANIGAGRHLSVLIGAAKWGKNNLCWTWPMKTKSSNSKSHIPQLVERGFAIHQQLTLLNEEFKKIKDRLKDETSARPNEHLPLLEKDSEGYEEMPANRRAVGRSRLRPCPITSLFLRQVGGSPKSISQIG